MSNIKISQLPQFAALDTNTANSYFVTVDAVQGITGKISAQAIANNLFSNTALVVGQNPLLFSNTSAQFSGSDPSFLQINNQNFNSTGSVDYIATIDTGTNTTGYIDLGINNSQWNPAAVGQTSQYPYDGYLYVQGPGSNGVGNLVFSTAATNTNILTTIGGLSSSNIITRVSQNGIYYYKDLTVSSNIFVTNVISSNITTANISYGVYAPGLLSSASNTMVAAGSTQGTATLLNYDINVVSSGSGGVVAPLAVPGKFLVVINRSSSPINLYPNTGHSFDGYGTNTPISLPVNAYVEMYGSTSSQWNTTLQALVQGTYVVGSVANATYANTSANAINVIGGIVISSNITTNTITANSIITASGNLIIDPSGTFDVILPSNTELFIQSGAAAVSNVQGALVVTGGIAATGNVYAGNYYVTGSGNGITFVDGTQQTTNAASYAYTQAAFAKANGALANTSGSIFGGNLTVTGNVTLNGLTVLSGNITGNVIGSSTAGTIQWSPYVVPPAQSFGQLWYSANDTSLIEDTDITGDRPILGKVLYERVYNGTGATIGTGTWVRISGPVTSNAIPYVQYADATNSANAAVVGFVKNAINAGAYGICYVSGIVNNTNQSSFSSGDQIFLSTTPGAAQNTAPTGANVVVKLAQVLNNVTSNGKLQVAIIQSPQYGKANGSVIYANNNVLVASNTITINDSTQTLSMNGSITLIGGTVTVNNNTFGPTTSAFRIDGSNGFIAQATSQSGTMMQVIGLANTPTRIITDAYSATGNAYALWAGRSARGTAATPTASQAGDVLARYSGNGYGATGYAPLGVARMDIVAAENYSDTNKGSQIQFSATTPGTNTIVANVVTISSSALTVNTNSTLIANTVTIGSGATIAGNTVPSQYVGTWTPSFAFATTQGSQTYTQQIGNYIKTGREVFATFSVITSADTGSGNFSLNLTGLPTPASVGGSAGSLIITFNSIAGNFAYMSGNVASGATSVPVYGGAITIGTPQAGTVTYRQLTEADLGATATISGTIQYISAS